MAFELVYEAVMTHELRQKPRVSQKKGNPHITKGDLKKPAGLTKSHIRSTNQDAFCAGPSHVKTKLEGLSTPF